MTCGPLTRTSSPKRCSFNVYDFSSRGLIEGFIVCESASFINDALFLCDVCVMK